ncbi:MAG TPA: hypothetical protein VMU22_10720 [Rhizomicrobium sp.]|nr:hypothetical protein [Rhizomicrobium sp.]
MIPARLRKYGLFFRTKIGTCPTCMRWSLQGALAGWLVLAAAFVAYRPLAAVIAIWPLTFTVLWLMHVLTFGGRVVRFRMMKDADVRAGNARVLTRRNMLLFARATAIAVTLSAVVPQRARASDEDGCPGNMHICSDGQHCCPPGGVVDCIVDDCDASKSRTCYPGDDDSQKYVSQCCSVAINC